MLKINKVSKTFNPGTVNEKWGQFLPDRSRPENRRKRFPPPH